MKKIEEKMLKAVRNGFNMRVSNTTVNHCNGVCRVYLFNNLIYKRENGIESFSLAGWNTVTTRSRLNALGVGVYQKNFKPFYKGARILTNVFYLK